MSIGQDDRLLAFPRRGAKDGESATERTSGISELDRGVSTTLTFV